MNKPEFSVIIPTFNRSHQLLHAVQSIVDQTYSNWECIIIDDGSTDQTQELIQQHFANDSRVKYYFQTNQERSIARNNGIDKSLGEYLCFLDSDDYYDKYYLESLKDAIDKESAELILTSIRYHKSSGVEEILPKLSDLELDNIFANSIVVGRCCIKKSSLAETRFEPKIKISEDTVFLCDIVSQGIKTAFSSASFLEYIEHDDNSVNYKKYNAYQDRLDTLSFLLSRPYASKLSAQIVKQTLNNCYFGIAKYYFYQGKFWKARLSMLKALLKYPTIRFKEKFYLFLFVRNKELHK